MAFKNKVIEKEYKHSWYLHNRNDILHKDKIRYAKNRESIKINNKIRSLNYYKEWIAYFKRKYGEYPHCQICGTSLKYNDHYNGVHFDHRKPNLPIKSMPTSFCNGHPCNEKNIKIWDSCNFGILCGICNTKLFTNNRIVWLSNAVQYVVKGVIDENQSKINK